MLDQPPVFPDEFHVVAGYRLDYKGLGIFLYKSEKRAKWVSVVVLTTHQYVIVRQNNGLQPIVASRNMDDIDDQLIDPKHACEIDMSRAGELQGIRVKILMDYIYISKRESEVDVYENCIVN